MEKKSRVLLFTQTVLVITGLLLMFLVFMRANAATPQITLTADPQVVGEGGSTVITWDVVDAISCESFNYLPGAKPLVGTETISDISDDITYGLRCFGDSGEITESEVTIIVSNPPTLNFYADSLLVKYNDTAVLYWDSTNADTCVADGAWSGDVGTSGTYTTDKLISAKGFFLACEGSGGTIEKFINIEVGARIDAPQLLFTANEYFLEYEQATTLTWNSLNSTVCTASGSWSGDKNFSGVFDTGSLTDSETYILECLGEGGSVTKIVNITVAPEPTFPVELTFTADDAFVDYGESTTLRWTTEHADHCHGEWTSDWLDPNGTYNIGPLTSSVSVGIQCDGDGGSANQTIYVEVGPNPNPLPILNFDADANAIEFNTSTNLVWSTENADTVVASLDWSGVKTLSGSYNTGNLTEEMNYRLEAEGPGGVVNKIIDVVVDDPDNPPAVDYWADEYSVAYNSGTNLHWSTEFADWCYLGIDGDDYWVPTSGNEETGNLTDNLVTTMECGNAAGSTTISLQVTVNLLGEPPVITAWADSYEVEHNYSTDVHWTTENADECRWDDIGSVGVAGTRDSGRVYMFDRTLRIECIGPGGVTDETITIMIVPGSAFEVIPMVHVWADETTFYSSGRTNVHWTTENAEWCETYGHWEGEGIAFNGTIDTGDFHQTRTYGVTCGNNEGESSSSVTLSITDMPNVSLDFWADETQIPSNGFTNLNWYGRSALTCLASGSWSSSKAASEERFETVGPLSYYTNVFNLECWNWTSSDAKTVIVYAGEPPPTVTFEAPYRVGYNSPAFLTWSSENADYCWAWSNNSQENTWTGEREAQGSQLSSNLRSSTRFYLECYGPGGSSRENEYVYVGSSTGSPPAISLWADDYLIEPGGETTLHWDTENVSSSCNAYSDPYNTAWSGSVASDGAVTLTPSDIIIDDGGEVADPGPEYTQIYEYVLWCSNSSGAALVNLSIAEGSTVVERPSVSLWADNYIVGDGGSTILRWNAENAVNCELSDNVSGSTVAISSGSGQMFIGPISAQTTYEMKCENEGGATTTSATIGIGGVGLDMTLEVWADDYDLSAGESTTLRWISTNASSCEATGSVIDDWSGSQQLVGQAVIRPDVSNNFELTCYSPTGIVTRNIEIVVAKLLICPNPAIVTKGTDYNLVSWYKKNADEAFSCEDTSGAIDVTNGFTEGMLPGDQWDWKSLARVFGIKTATADDFFATDWASTNSSFVSSAGGGSVHGVEYTSVLGTPVAVTATYKEATGSTNVLVLPPPITCWRCSNNKNCLAEVQYPEDGLCGIETYTNASTCRSVCKKPTDWVEVSP